MLKFYMSVRLVRKLLGYGVRIFLLTCAAAMKSVRHKRKLIKQLFFVSNKLVEVLLVKVLALNQSFRTTASGTARERSNMTTY